MNPTITAFKQSPDRGRGLARDMRVRWALEEVGQAYDVRLLTFKEMKEPAHLALHPSDRFQPMKKVSVLLRLGGSGLLDKHPKLPAYVARGDERPAYKRAFAAQLAVFKAASSGE